MSNFTRESVLIMFIFLLFGCSNDGVENVKFNVLASEKTLPTNFHEISYHKYLVKKASNQSEFEENWDLFDLEQAFPDVNFNENDVFFIGLYESGSCESEIKNLQFVSEENKLILPISGPGGACTVDASPKTFVIELKQDLSYYVNELIIVENGETSVPFD